VYIKDAANEEKRQARGRIKILAPNTFGTAIEETNPSKYGPTSRERKDYDKSKTVFDAIYRNYPAATLESWQEDNEIHTNKRQRWWSEQKKNSAKGRNVMNQAKSKYGQLRGLAKSPSRSGKWRHSDRDQRQLPKYDLQKYLCSRYAWTQDQLL
jgi:hypothetical protein